MNFGAIEVLVAAMIEKFDPPDPSLDGIGRFKDRISTLGKIAASRLTATDPAGLGELTAALAEIDTLNTERHQMIHAAWLDKTGTDLDSVKTRLTRVNGKVTEILTTPDDVTQLADRTNESFHRLRKIDFMFDSRGAYGIPVKIAAPMKYAAIQTLNPNTAPANIFSVTVTPPPES